MIMVILMVCFGLLLVQMCLIMFIMITSIKD